jgi:steroid delta-isomerase-like uncharacterized protein
MKSLKIKQVAERSTTMKGLSSLAVVYVVTVGILGSGCSSSSTMQLERNKALVRQMSTVAPADRLARIQEFVAPEYLWHQSGGKPMNLDETKKFFREFFNAYPDFRATVDDMVAEGDKVVTRYTAHATHKGAFRGTPASGKEVTFTGICISRFKDGKIVEEWEEADTLGLASQVGAITLKK